jgi:2-phospho-L-lactate/phosphoenolpyruvate guanylyltransferase
VWSVVIPVKRLPEAKSRLAPLSGERRAALALAFASDTVAAAAASPLVAEVFAVTDDEAVARRLGGLGARILPDGVDLNGYSRLNSAIEAGRLRALADAPRRRVAALTSDLPGLRTADLTDALLAVPEGRAFVADTPGSGTTLLLSDAAGRLSPRFGPNSRHAHEASGAALLPDVGASLRRDVDTVADLAEVVRLGVGEHTAAALVRLRWPETGSAAHYPGAMQATVRIFDPATRSGSVLLDDGTELAYDGAAFDAGGLRFARPGQRVALRVDGEGRITALTLATLPLPG